MVAFKLPGSSLSGAELSEKEDTNPSSSFDLREESCITALKCGFDPGQCKQGWFSTFDSVVFVIAKFHGISQNITMLTGLPPLL